MLERVFMGFLGAVVRGWIDEALEARINSVVLGRAARVATQTILGVAPIRNMTSPNGDTVSEAAIWMGVDTETAQNAIWCPIARGVTLTATGGDYVHVTRDSTGSRVWTVDRKL